MEKQYFVKLLLSQNEFETALLHDREVPLVLAESYKHFAGYDDEGNWYSAHGTNAGQCQSCRALRKCIE
jgi:hypothetical protein